MSRNYDVHACVSNYSFLSHGARNRQTVMCSRRYFDAGYSVSRVKRRPAQFTAWHQRKKCRKPPAKTYDHAQFLHAKFCIDLPVVGPILDTWTLVIRFFADIRCGTSGDGIKPQ